MRLTTADHDRDGAGLQYVYPVLSRRARGVSVGINLNPNNACNWQCVYCQVPDLVLGRGPELDLDVLRQELHSFLSGIVRGDWLERNAPEGSRRLNDIAISGNGEATTSRQFGAAVECAGKVLEDLNLVGKLRYILISNGSQVHQPGILQGLERLASFGGELWFKLDSATPEGRTALNVASISQERLLLNLRSAAAVCPTRIQTMLLALDGDPPSSQEQAAYLGLLSDLHREGVQLEEILLYGYERQSMQPGAERLSKLPTDWLESFGERVRRIGFAVSVHP